MKPEFLLTIVLIYVAGYVTLLAILRKRLASRLGPQGHILLWGFAGSYFIPALGWLAGISAPLNDPSNPVLRGTGGYYGLNYDYFPATLVIYLVPPALALLISLLLSKSSVHMQSVVIVMKQLGSQLRIERIAYLGLALSVLLTVWYFTVVGWDRFWFSNIDRFESESDYQVEFSIRIALTFTLAAGCLGSALVVFRGLFIISTLTVLITALPFIAFASRGMAVLMAAYAVGVFFRVPTGRRWLVVLPLLFSIYQSLQLPLEMRGARQTGILVAAQQLFRESDHSSNLADGVAASFQNLGQGFGLMVEEREADANGSNIVQDVPMTYFLLSVSPTFSRIDGFSRNWVMWHPRFNHFSPFSGLCELTALSPFLGIGFPVFWYLVALYVCRRGGGKSMWHDVGLFAFVLLMTLGFLQLQQYPLRTGTRFFYAAFVLYGILVFFNFLLKTHSAGKPVAKALGLLVKPSLLPRRTKAAPQSGV